MNTERKARKEKLLNQARDTAKHLNECNIPAPKFHILQWVQVKIINAKRRIMAISFFEDHEGGRYSKHKWMYGVKIGNDNYFFFLSESELEEVCENGED